MLRITTSTAVRSATIAVEGRIAGPWVAELAASWHALLVTHDGDQIRVDLAAVTFVDAAGKALLRAMHERGAVLLARECMTRAIVDEIAATNRSARRPA